MTKQRSRHVIIFAVCSLLFSVLAACGVFYVQRYVLPKNHAHNALESIHASKGDIVPAAVTLKTFTGQRLEGATAKQKSLVATGYPESEKSAEFVFTPEYPDDNTKTIDLYVSFGSQVSRDFMLINQKNFEGLLTSGQAVVKIHPVPGGSMFSMYGAHTVADCLAQSPEHAWQLMFDLMKASAKASDMVDKEEIQELIVSTAHESGFADVRAESLNEGRFGSWLLAVGDDANLQNTFAPPILVVDGRKVQPSVVNYNNPDEVLQAIGGKR